MFEREHLVGWLLLATCAIAGGVLVWSMLTGNELVYTGPGWLPPVLAVAYLGATIYLFIRSRRNL